MCVYFQALSGTISSLIQPQDSAKSDEEKRVCKVDGRYSKVIVAYCNCSHCNLCRQCVEQVDAVLR